MAFTFTDLNKLNISDLSEVISLTIGEAGEIAKSTTVLNGIENNTPVATFEMSDKALELSSGCVAPTSKDAKDKVKYYTHAPIQLPVQVCLQEIWGKMLAAGIKLSDDFSETELAGFLQAQILKVAEADLLRLAWLDGAVKEDATGYGIMKRGGFIKQFTDASGVMGALELTSAGVLTALRAAIDNQRSDQLADSEFFVTPNVMRLYKNLLQDRDNSAAQSDIVDGRPVYYFEGYKINELSHVGNAAKADGTYDAFIAFTPKSNLQIAMEASDIAIAPFLQDAVTRKYYSTTVFAADAMLVVPEFLQLHVHTAEVVGG